MGTLYSYLYMLFRWYFKYFLFLLICLGVIIFLFPNLFVVLVILVFLLLNLFLYFSLKPFGEVGPVGKYSSKNNDCDFLLVVSVENIKKSSAKKDFFRQDWSCNWINTLKQEVGNYSVLDVSEFDKFINSKSAIIVSKSASAALSSKNIRNLGNFVKNGGILVLEQPDNRLGRMSGIKFSNGVSNNIKARKIDFISSNFKSYSVLKDMPLNTSFKKIEDVDKDTDILLGIDSNPAIILKRKEKGIVLTLSFDYCLQLLSLQQGVPSNKYGVKSKNGLKGLVEPIDMLFSKKMIENKVPFADLLEKFIFEVLNNERPFPRLWYFPGNYSGTMMMSHDEDYYGKKSTPMLKYEESLDVESTFFLNSPTELDKRIVNDFNVEVGIHWDKTPNLFRGPFFAKKSLLVDFKSQLNYLVSKGFNVVSSRIHFLMWDNHYTKTFRILHKAGIKVDSTYGSNFRKGYFFGNGYGFYPLDTNGFLIPLLEIPFQIIDGRAHANLNYLKSILNESKDKYHENVTILFHPSKIMKNRKLNEFWKRSYNLANKNNHLITSLKKNYNFSIGRGESTVSSEFTKNKLKIFADAKLDGLSLAVPSYFSGRKIKKVKNMGSVSVMGINYVLVSLKKGINKITLKYD